MRRHQLKAGPFVASVAFTDRATGDMRLDGDPAALAAHRAAVHPGEWSWCQQVHGNEVVVVDAPGAHRGTPGDALVVAIPDVPIAVLAADCGNVVLVGNGAVAVAHVGWRGLLAGVLPAVTDRLADVAPGPLRAVVGPNISAANYEFGADDLATVAAAVGAGVVAETADGVPALDLRAGIIGQLDELGVQVVASDDRCTRSTRALFSHRGGDVGRQAAVAWLERA